MYFEIERKWQYKKSASGRKYLKERNDYILSSFLMNITFVSQVFFFPSLSKSA